MTDGSRTDRVSEEFREILAEEVPRLKDPRVGFVTITGVDVTPDLRRAVVYYTVLGEEEERRATDAGLRSARAHLRQVIGGQVRLKVVPELEFRLDETSERAARVEELLDRIGGPGEGEGPEPRDDEEDG